MSSTPSAAARFVAAVLLLAATTMTGGCCMFYSVRPAKASLQCNFGSLPRASSTDPDRALAASDTSGIIKGKSVTLPAGTTIVVSGDLIISSASTLQIDGRIEFPSGKDTSLSVTLVSDGTITIGPTGFIGGGKAYPGVDCPLKDAGWHGGQIRLVAASTINVIGELKGQEGGDGFSRSSGNPITAGNGGEGGDILLCAVEQINIPGTVTAGLGGSGGSATSDKPSNAAAVATAGNGGTGGFVKFEFAQAGALPNLSTPTNITGSATAGDGGPGGTPTVATGDSYWASGNGGQNAQATGGNGGDGGDIMCVQVTFTASSPTTGNGGRGGQATATGGNGANAWWRGPYNGGNAVATGGNGGAPGGCPTCSAGSVSTGTAGPGGNAMATSGNGGSNTGWGTPGSSGSATATGGANGNKVAGTSASIPAAPPTGTAGGIGSGVPGTGAP